MIKVISLLQDEKVSILLFNLAISLKIIITF